MVLSGRPDQFEDCVAVLEMRQKSQVVRIRGVPDKGELDLKTYLANVIAECLGEEQDYIAEAMDSCYHVRTKSAKTRELPGDCLVIFNSKKLKDAIVQNNYENRLQIDGNMIFMLKEIPPRLLQKCQKYKFLTNVLTRVNIQFRWEFPEEISFTYKKQRHRLTNSEQAQDFCQRYGRDFDNPYTPSEPVGATGGTGEGDTGGGDR